MGVAETIDQVEDFTDKKTEIKWWMYVTKHELLKNAVSKGIIDLSDLDCYYLEIHQYSVRDNQRSQSCFGG